MDIAQPLALWAHLRARRKIQLLLLVLLTLLAAVAELLSIGAALPFLALIASSDSFASHSTLQKIQGLFIVNNTPPTTLELTTVFVATSVAAMCVRLFLLWAQMRVSHKIGSDLSVKLFETTLFQPYIIHRLRNSSRIISSITTKVTGVVNQSILPVITGVSSFIILLTLVSLLFYISGMIAAMLVLPFIFLYMIIALISRNIISVRGQVINAKSNFIIKVAQEAFLGIKNLIIDGGRKHVLYKFQSADSELRHALGFTQFIAAAPRLLVEGVALISMALAGYFAVVRTSDPGMVIAIIGTVALGAQRCLPLIQNLYRSWTSIASDHASLREIIDLMSAAAPLPRNDLVEVRFAHSIELRGASFAYSDERVGGARDVNLLIRKGARIGIMGPSGGGKTTLIDMLMGLITPQEGSLLVDGLPIDAQNSNAFQAIIAHVPQFVHLSDASIAENIAFGAPEKAVDQARVRNALDLAGLGDLVRQSRLGLYTPVGERGMCLSGGQLQRLGIARALYKKAEIIVLDEATSALDSDTEASVMEAIYNLEKTITLIIVSHRPECLIKCDEVFSINTHLCRIR